jgi:hypothetical protein
MPPPDPGVSVTTDGATAWVRENVGFGNVITEHLEIINGRLYAFTYRRSLFSAPIAQQASTIATTSRSIARRSSWRRPLFVFATLVMAWPLWLPLTCPLVMFFASAEKHTLVALKNRTALPVREDIDARATLDALLAPGPDRYRWSYQRAAVVEGFVVNVQPAGIELANCFKWTRRDIHIDVALRPDAPPRERLVLEVTPALSDRARTEGHDWSARALQSLLGRRVRFEGWLLFDWEHDEESENSRPERPGNWRATAWELHPITAITPM